MRAIHQLVAGFGNGDAISNEARALRAIFQRWGAASEIYCDVRRTMPDLRGEARDLDRAAAEIGPDDVTLLHLSIGSPANLLFPQLRGRKALLYHNITPAEFFQGVREETARQLALGREQARALSGAAAVVMADSPFNAAELAAWGYGPAHVLPLVLDFGFVGTPPDRGLVRQFGAGGVNVLFVGRGVPNKRIEDLLAAFYYFQKYVEPDSRFFHIGSYAGTERYRSLAQARVRDLRLRNVTFAGSVRQPELTAYYRTAHVFLCLSEHEGFCVPILESMIHGVPVLAFAAGAVPDTLDGAGVLVPEKRFDLIAEMMGRLAREGELRTRVIEGQRARVERFRAIDHERLLRQYLAPLWQP